VNYQGRALLSDFEMRYFGHAWMSAGITIGDAKSVRVQRCSFNKGYWYGLQTTTSSSQANVEVLDNVFHRVLAIAVDLNGKFATVEGNLAVIGIHYLTWRVPFANVTAPIGDGGWDEGDLDSWTGAQDVRSIAADYRAIPYHESGHLQVLSPARIAIKTFANFFRLKDINLPLVCLQF